MFIARSRLILLCVALTTLTACRNPAKVLESVDVSETWDLGCLEEEVHVLRTRGNLPHVYAQSRADIACALASAAPRSRRSKRSCIRRAF